MMRIMVGYALLIIPGLVMIVRNAVYAPVVLMEGLEKKAALKRARELAGRSWRTDIAAVVVQLAANNERTTCIRFLIRPPEDVLPVGRATCV